jgi:hypothetical protein
MYCSLFWNLDTCHAEFDVYNKLTTGALAGVISLMIALQLRVNEEHINVSWVALQVGGARCGLLQ